MNFNTFSNPAEAAIFDNNRNNSGASSFGAVGTGPIKIGSHQFRATNAQKQLRGKKRTNSDIFGNSILNRTGPVKLSSGVKAEIMNEGRGDNSDNKQHKAGTNSADPRPSSAH